MTGRFHAICISLAFVILLSLSGAVAQETQTIVTEEDLSSDESVFFDYLNPPRSGGGFLHIPGLNFHSSIGASFYSGGFESVGVGYYMGHFSMRLSSSWAIRWDMGVMTNVTGPQAGQQAQFVIPNLDLVYRPSDKFILRLQYRQYRYPNSMLWRGY
jgi:hypothetical protein